MLILVRHGQSTGNANGLLLGRMDAPLTAEGRDQARCLASVVAGASRLISSPLRRALDTAEELGTGLRIEVDDRWVEVDYGEFDGRPLRSVPEEAWMQWRTDPDYHPPGGESLSEAGERVRTSLEELFAIDGAGARAETPVVVVSHVTPIKAATCWALGLGTLGAWRLHLATASVTCITWRGSGPVLSQFNATPRSGTER